MSNNDSIFTKYFEIKAFYLLGPLGPFLVLLLIGLAYIFFTYGIIATVFALIVLYGIFEIFVALFQRWMKKNQKFQFHKIK